MPFSMQKPRRARGSTSTRLAGHPCWRGMQAMLEHLNSTSKAPQRLVVIGAAGFVGKAVAARMERDGVPVLRITRDQVDLSAAGAGARLAALLRTGDAVV